MAITFNSIPTNLRTPGSYVEVDATNAQQNATPLAYRVLLIGQKLAGGTATADTIVKVSSLDQVITLAGRGSLLHREYLAWSAVNKSTEVWIGVLADNGAGVAAQGTITVTGPATAAGTIYLYVGGERLTIGVNVGDAQNTVATAIGAAINAAADLPITAAVATNVVTWTFRHKGAAGQGYDVRVNYNDNEALPAGITLAIAATTAGITNPTLTNLIAATADVWFQIWAHPYTDATSLTAIETELATRFGPTRQQPGVAITSAVGTFSALGTLGAGRNSPHSSIIAQAGVAPLTPAFEFATETAGLVAYYGAIDPARPFQTLAYVRAKPVPETDRFDEAERNLLEYTGIATSKRVAGGVTQIERMIMTYETSPSGASDTAYLDMTTLLTLIYLRYTWRTRIQTRYPRHKLASDTSRIGSGQPIITPKIGKAEAIAWFREMEVAGLVENFDQFKRDLQCLRNADPNRLDWQLVPDLVNQFIVNATQIKFLL